MTLPGMPARIGDPGVFACGPRDIAPWETEPVPAARPLAAVPYGATAPARRTWLVLTNCMQCNPRTGIYCKDHNAANWWLTQWGGGRKRNAPGSTT